MSRCRMSVGLIANIEGYSVNDIASARKAHTNAPRPQRPSGSSSTCLRQQLSYNRYISQLTLEKLISFEARNV